MNTKLIMTSSAIILGIIGISFTFLPHEILNYLGEDSLALGPLILQMAGAIYLGFAYLNWMAKSLLIGGIYARPIAMGNFTHFFIAALALSKEAFPQAARSGLWILAIIFLVFTILFGLVLFRHPLKTIEKS